MNKLKITVTSKGCEEDIKYPCLMISQIGVIALIININKNSGLLNGVIIKDPTDRTNISFNNVLNPTYWKPFHGKITLEQ